MRALDTNVLARYIVQDDPVHTKIAESVLQEPCFVSDTVLLELGWLLSSRYRVGRADLAATLGDLLRLPTIHVGDEAALGWAIDRFAAGADLADMFHVVSSRGLDSFATFDDDVAPDAGPTPPVAIETLG